MISLLFRHGYTAYLKKNLKYPEKALKAKVSGNVYVAMIIDENGNISNVHVEKDNVGYGCGDEAVRVIKEMAPWQPAKQNGKSFKTTYVVPVKFVLP